MVSNISDENYPNNEPLIEIETPPIEETIAIINRITKDLKILNNRVKEQVTTMQNAAIIERNLINSINCLTRNCQIKADTERILIESIENLKKHQEKITSKL